MANEITFQVKMSLSNGNVSDSYSSPNIRADQSIARLVRNTAPVTTTPAVLDPGDIITPGLALFVNLSDDETDYIEIGNYTGGTFYPLTRINYGEQHLFRVAIPAAQLYARSNVLSGVMLFYIIYND